MSSPLLFPKTIGSKQVGMYAWYIVQAGLDANGNPVGLKVNADGTPRASQLSASTTPAIATANGDAITLAAGQKAIIQNLDDTPLAVRYGTGCSATVFNFILKAGTAADDGLGGSVIIDDWIGVVSVFAMTGSPRFVATKLS